MEAIVDNSQENCRSFIESLINSYNVTAVFNSLLFSKNSFALTLLLIFLYLQLNSYNRLSENQLKLVDKIYFKYRKQINALKEEA